MRHTKRPSKPAKRTGPPVVGVIVDGVTTYGRSILRGVMRYTNLQRRWVLHVDMWNNIAEVKESYPECDGAIVAGMEPEIFQYVLDHTPHVIHASGSGDPASSPIVCLDDRAAGAMAAEHLIDCRLTHFAFYGAGNQKGVAVRRLEGFRAKLQERGFDCTGSPLAWPMRGTFMLHQHHAELIDWVRSLPKPVGIMCADDAVAFDLAAACRTGDIAVPEQVAIIGVNNDELLCETAYPTISSVIADFSRMGYHSARLLDLVLAGEKLKPEDRYLVLPPLGVAKRVSTDLLAIADVDLSSAIRFIREHACDPCTVSEVADHVAVGRRWLERQFMVHLHRTPHDEIIRVRIETARHLLARSDLKTEEIARRCGCAGAPSFNRMFMQATGTTPAAFRRSSRQGVVSTNPTD